LIYGDLVTALWQSLAFWFYPTPHGDIVLFALDSSLDSPPVMPKEIDNEKNVSKETTCSKEDYPKTSGHSGASGWQG
jgi:hypothetical protein